MDDTNSEPETPAPPPSEEPETLEELQMRAWIERTTGRVPEPPPIEVTP